MFGYFYWDWADSTTPIKEVGEASITKNFANKKDANFPANPANSVVKNNVIVWQSKYIGKICTKAKKYSDISNNTLYKFKNDLFVSTGNYNLKKPIEGFQNIPFDKIGRQYFCK